MARRPKPAPELPQLPAASAEDKWQLELSLRTSNTWRWIALLELDPERDRLVEWLVRYAWLQGYTEALQEPMRGETFLRYGYRVPEAGEREPQVSRPSSGPKGNPSDPERFD